MPRKPIPVFRLGRRAGYDPITRHYRSISGEHYASRQKFLEARSATSLTGEVIHGGWVNAPSRTPTSDFLNNLERVVLRASKGEDVSKNPTLLQAAKRYNRIIAATAPYNPGQTRPIPADVRASMQLADFYDLKYGDVHQHIEKPIRIATGSELDISCSDKGWEREVRQAYERIGMWTVLWRAWMGATQYGLSLPYEIWKDNELLQILDLPPFYVWIGYNLAFGTVLPDKVEKKAANYALLPINDADQWDAQAVQQFLMPMSFNQMGLPQNSNLPGGWNIELSTQRLQPIRSMSYGYQRYPTVPLSRAYLDLGTRMVFDETTRATLEGHLSQLWVLTVDSNDAEEMAALQATVAGLSGEHTGYLLWRKTLSVASYAPKTMEQLMAPETRQAMTLQIFRDLGGNVRIETGNPLIGQRETAADSVDLSMWLGALEHPRTQVLNWEKYLRGKLAGKSQAAKKSNDKMTVRWTRSLLEVADLIENELGPLYKLGTLSRRTLLTKAGYNYDTERANKVEEQPDAEIWSVPTTYAQETVNPGTPAKTTATAPAGRPKANDLAAALLVAAWADDSLRLTMLQFTTDSLTQLLADRDGAAFIMRLRESNHQYLAAAAQASYEATGGAGQLPYEVADYAAAYLDPFAERFGQQLVEALQDENVDPASYASRAISYVIEGFKMATINGQRLAMQAKGARFWRRVVADTACPLCQADARVGHPIAEPFTILHPQESCAADELSVVYDNGLGLSTVHIPVPSYTNEAIEAMRSALGSRTTKTRRARSKRS